MKSEITSKCHKWLVIDVAALLLDDQYHLSPGVSELRSMEVLREKRVAIFFRAP